jgi:hypothetical protein
MTPHEFIHKWKQANLSERSGCQQHFLDLCELLNQPKPAAADPDGAFYTFERGVRKQDGTKGWADVWMRGHFAWEYKKKHRDLAAAFSQLQLYRDDLENPPLLVVCDLDRFEVHTNFTNTVKQVFAFDLDHLSEPAHLDVLRKLFTAPDALKPAQTPADIAGPFWGGGRQDAPSGLEALHAHEKKKMLCANAEYPVNDRCGLCTWGRGSVK